LAPIENNSPLLAIYCSIRTVWLRWPKVIFFNIFTGYSMVDSPVQLGDLENHIPDDNMLPII
jgi:hypothetical protein